MHTTVHDGARHRRTRRPPRKRATHPVDRRNDEWLCCVRGVWPGRWGMPSGTTTVLVPLPAPAQPPRTETRAHAAPVHRMEQTGHETRAR